MVKALLIGVAMTATLNSIEVDKVRLKAERAADVDVLQSLHRNDDCGSAVRSIDLRFVGSDSGITKLSAKASDLGFTVIQLVQMPNGEIAIDLSIRSDVLPSTIDRLTVNALKIAIFFKLRYDGWGTLATKC